MRIVMQLCGSMTTDKNMNYNNDGDRSATVVVSCIGAANHYALVVKEKPGFEEMPVFNKYEQYDKSKAKENWYNPKTVYTQFILNTLGTVDEKSLQQQFDDIKVKRLGHKIDRGYASLHHPGDFICAEVLSQVWDRVGGKMDGVVFTYTSMEFQFKARWDTFKGKFVPAN